MPGFSEDYACLAYALLDLFETDFDLTWLRAARRLAALLDEKFLDTKDGTYFYVARDQDTPLVRSKSAFDQTVPSGNSMAARLCTRLYRLTEEKPYQERALSIFSRFQSQARQNPFAFAHLWTAQTLHLAPPLDLTLVGDPRDPRLKEMLQVAYRHFLPERHLLVKDPKNCAALEELIPAARTYAPVGEGPVTYICRDFTCGPPITDPGELVARLEELKG